MKAVRFLPSYFLVSFFFMLHGPATAQTDSNMVAISVSAGMAPVFSWTPDNVTVGRLVVQDGEIEVWSS